MSRLEAEKRHLNDILRLHESDCKRVRTNSYSPPHNQVVGEIYIFDTDLVWRMELMIIKG